LFAILSRNQTKKTSLREELNRRLCAGDIGDLGVESKEKESHSARQPACQTRDGTGVEGLIHGFLPSQADRVKFRFEGNEATKGKTKRAWGYKKGVV